MKAWENAQERDEEGVQQGIEGATCRNQEILKEEDFILQEAEEGSAPDWEVEDQVDFLSKGAYDEVGPFQLEGQKR